MYTSLVISARLKVDTPTYVIGALKNAIAGDATDMWNLAGHKRMRNVLNMCSSYFPESQSAIEETTFPHGFTINSVTSLKDYNGEIRCFLAWLKPYIDSGHGVSNWWAIETYEEDMSPTVYYLDKTEELLP